MCFKFALRMSVWRDTYEASVVEVSMATSDEVWDRTWGIFNGALGRPPARNASNKMHTDVHVSYELQR